MGLSIAYRADFMVEYRQQICDEKTGFSDDPSSHGLREDYIK
jgi:hypothetical protein